VVSGGVRLQRRNLLSSNRSSKALAVEELVVNPSSICASLSWSSVFEAQELAKLTVTFLVDFVKINLNRRHMRHECSGVNDGVLRLRMLLQLATYEPEASTERTSREPLS
jgi:hypothetical protein